MKKNHDLIKIKGFLRWETGKPDTNEGAYLIETIGNETVHDKKKVWLPKKLTEKHLDDSGFPNLFEFELPEWLAIEKDLV